jgi:hypothetical protein
VHERARAHEGGTAAVVESDHRLQVAVDAGRRAERRRPAARARRIAGDEAQVAGVERTARVDQGLDVGRTGGIRGADVERARAGGELELQRERAVHIGHGAPTGAARDDGAGGRPPSTFDTRPVTTEWIVRADSTRGRWRTPWIELEGTGDEATRPRTGAKIHMIEPP